MPENEVKKEEEAMQGLYICYACGVSIHYFVKKSYFFLTGSSALWPQNYLFLDNSG